MSVIVCADGECGTCDDCCEMAELLAMSDEDVIATLVAEGVDVAAAGKRMRKFLAGIVAEQKVNASGGTA